MFDYFIEILSMESMRELGGTVLSYSILCFAVASNARSKDDDNSRDIVGIAIIKSQMILRMLSDSCKFIKNWHPFRPVTDFDE